MQDCLSIAGARGGGAAENKSVVRPAIRCPRMTTRDVTRNGSNRMPGLDLASSVPSGEQWPGSGAGHAQ